MNLGGRYREEKKDINNYKVSIQLIFLREIDFYFAIKEMRVKLIYKFIKSWMLTKSLQISN